MNIICVCNPNANGDMVVDAAYPGSDPTPIIVFNLGTPVLADYYQAHVGDKWLGTVDEFGYGNFACTHPYRPPEGYRRDNWPPEYVPPTDAEPPVEAPTE